MTCHHKASSACPFADSEQSEIAQGLGCLPTPYEIVIMRVHHGKTWACHDNPAKPCAGAIAHLRETGQPYRVIDPDLLTEQSNWSLYAKP